MASKFLGRIEFPCEVELGRGLHGAITNITKIGYIDGEEGRLIYRGYSIDDLAVKSSFEEVAYLLLFGNLPTQSELSSFDQSLRLHGELPDAILQMISGAVKDAHPMNLLQACVAALGCHDPEALAVSQHTDNPAAALQLEQDAAIRVLSRTRSVAAAIARAGQGKPPLQPNPDLGFAGNALYMMTGEPPDATAERMMDLMLLLHADHGMNASTFTAMVVHSTLSDLYATMAAAIGSLKGPLHGGAVEGAFEDLLTIGGPDNAKKWVDDRLARGQKINGFGHLVYRSQDPRVLILKRQVETLCKQQGLASLYETATAVDEYVCELMQAEDKRIFPNIVFYSGLVYHALGFPTPFFPVIFSVARTAGWLARVLEYLPENCVFCPRAVYNGPTEKQYVPIGER